MAGKPGRAADRHRHALSGSRAQSGPRAGRGARRRGPSRAHRRGPIHRTGADRIDRERARAAGAGLLGGWSVAGDRRQPPRRRGAARRVSRAGTRTPGARSRSPTMRSGRASSPRSARPNGWQTPAYATLAGRAARRGRDRAPARAGDEALRRTRAGRRGCSITASPPPWYRPAPRWRTTRSFGRVGTGSTSLIPRWARCW